MGRVGRAIMLTHGDPGAGGTWRCPNSGSLRFLCCDHDGLTVDGDRDWNTMSLLLHGHLSVAVIVTGMGPFFLPLSRTYWGL